MIYQLLKLPIRLALYIFFSRISIRGAQHTRHRGPALLVANHPNSFLDAILIAALFKHPIHFLARGDAFRKPWHARLLRLLKMIPIYRMSEGRENLHLNQDAFDKAVALLKQGEQVLIFIEGISKHTDQLQPFKKGAARISIQASAQGTSFSIIPIQLRYQHYTGAGKEVLMQVHAPIPSTQLLQGNNMQDEIQHFNQQLFQIMQPVPEWPIEQPSRLPYLLPAIPGCVLHLPFYLPISRIIRHKTKQTIFNDSVLFGVLFFLYPFYLLLLFLLLPLSWQIWPVAAILMLVLAYSASQLHPINKTGKPG